MNFLIKYLETHIFYKDVYLNPITVGYFKINLLLLKPHWHPQPSEKPRDQALPLTHPMYKDNVLHMHSTATAPSARTILPFYLCDKSKPRVFKAAGK